MKREEFFFLEPIAITEAEVQKGLDRALRTCSDAQYIAFRDALDGAAKRDDTIAQAAKAAKSRRARSKTKKGSVTTRTTPHSLHNAERKRGGSVPKPTKDYARYWTKEVDKADKKIEQELKLRAKLVSAYEAVTEDTARYGSPPAYLTEYLESFRSPNGTRPTAPAHPSDRPPGRRRKRESE
jgi:hypothetical protein